MKPVKFLYMILLCAFAANTTASVRGESAVANQASDLLRELLDSPSSSVLIAAHRGGYENDRADRAPENSVANILTCKSKGYHLYETDIQRTKDGHFVIVHDPAINRETSGTGVVSEKTLGELKQLHKRYRNGSLSEEPVATLEEFLKQGKGHIVFKADLKPGVSKYFGEIMELVEKQDAMNGIIFRVPYSEAKLFAKHRSEGLRFAKHSLMFKVSSQQQIDEVKKSFDATTIQVNLDRSDPTNRKTLEIIGYAVGKGFLVETHAEGSPEDWAKLIDAGVRMFHTSAPSKVQKLLESLNK
jgi:glycerophosphoryl diester phosphodiesterase